MLICCVWVSFSLLYRASVLSPMLCFPLYSNAFVTLFPSLLCPLLSHAYRMYVLLHCSLHFSVLSSHMPTGCTFCYTVPFTSLFSPLTCLQDVRFVTLFPSLLCSLLTHAYRMYVLLHCSHHFSVLSSHTCLQDVDAVLAANVAVSAACFDCARLVNSYKEPVTENMVRRAVGKATQRCPAQPVIVRHIGGLLGRLEASWNHRRNSASNIQLNG